MAFTADRHYSFPFTLVTKSADGDLFCEGLATDGSIDHDQQIVDPRWAASAFKTFFDTGPNIRMAHDGTRPVGVGVDWREEPGGGIWVKSCIVDPLCQRMLRKGVLRAYSVGISHATVVADDRAPGGRIVKGSLAELSLVDRPANPNAYVTIAKAVGGRVVYTGEVHRPRKVGKSGKVKVAKSGKGKLSEQELLAVGVEAAREVARDEWVAFNLVNPDPRFREWASQEAVRSRGLHF